MNFGFFMPCYNDIQNIKESLSPWMEYRNLDKENNWTIGVIDTCFKGFEVINNSHQSTDGTLEYLTDLRTQNKIDFVDTLPTCLLEHEVKTIGLNKLKKYDIDYFFTFATDEVLTIEQIATIVKYIKRNPFIAWYKTAFKNFVFDRQHFTLDFIAQRIYKTRLNNLIIDRFCWDDDLIYHDGTEEIRMDSLASLTIPNLLINHYTWCDKERCKNKILYQEKHFERGAGCSFKWNIEKDCLEWNAEYFRKIGQIIPEVYEN